MTAVPMSTAKRRLALVSDHLEWIRPSVSRATFTSSPSSTGSSPASTDPSSSAAVEFLDSRNRAVWSFVTASAFHGKPTDKSTPKPVHQLPASSPIRRWVDSTLEKHASSIKGKAKGGEDWWMVQEMRDRSGVALGVADGVGGWTDEGVDPSEVSQGLMYYAAKAAEGAFAGEEQLMDDDEVSAPSTDTEGSAGEVREAKRPKRKDPRVVHPHEIVAKAFAGVLADADVHGGASTALVSTLNSRSGELRWSNLGDSMIVVLRDFKVVAHSAVQTHYFNCPYQLSKFPPGYLRRPGILTDEPRQSGLGKFQLQDGDLVILYTDGFGDNVFPVELERAAKTVMETEAEVDPTSAVEERQEDELALEEKRVERLAFMLCYLARIRSLQTDQETPFEREARANRIYDIRGGKFDDITVVVALCRER